MMHEFAVGNVSNLKRKRLIIRCIWLFWGLLLPWFRQVAVAVAIHVQGFAIQNQPDMLLCFGTEDQKAVLWGLRRVSGFLLDHPFYRFEIGAAGERRNSNQSKEAQGAHGHNPVEEGCSNSERNDPLTTSPITNSDTLW